MKFSSAAPNIATITNTLLHELDSEPSDQTNLQINHILHSDSPPHPKLIHHKSIFVEITQPSPRTIQRIITTISSLWPDSFPTCTTCDPTTYTTSEISTTPFQSPEWPRYCQITSCPMHNNGNPCVPDSPEGMNTIHLHAKHIHKHLFLALPHEQLPTIGWSRCSPTCHDFFLTSANQLASHQNQCPFHLTNTNTATSNNTTTNNNNPILPQVYDSSNNPTWAIAFNICPPEKYTDLNQLINDADDFVDPSTVLPSILMTVSQWNLDCATRSTPPTYTTTTPATTNNNND
jgi:hypothetical protein